MKEGARAERGTVLFSLSCFSGFSGLPNQTYRIDQIDQLPATRCEMFDSQTFFLPLLDYLLSWMA